MKTAPVVSPHAAFPDEQRPPAESDLPEALGRSFAALAKILAGFRADHPDVTSEWKYSPRSGWHLIFNRKKRRIFYLIPARGDFRLSLILGDKAIAALQSGPGTAKRPALLKEAKRYPEGTAFNFAGSALDVAVTLAFLNAKLAH